VERKDWISPESILAQMQDRLLSTDLKYITLAGSGEPTLYSKIGDLILAIKDMTDIPVAVLTNGSLLSDPRVQTELCNADIVLPSLDAGNERLFRHVNRPHRNINFHHMVNGLIEFRNAFPGQYWLEVFLLGGITALPGPVEELAEIVDKIKPERIQLNTVTRPPAESFAMTVPEDLMLCLATAFGDRAEVITDYKGIAPDGNWNGKTSQRKGNLQDITELIIRRPCTLEDIVNALGLGHNEAVKAIEVLLSKGIIRSELVGRRRFFRVARD
jgi:wyosine [tRNA(Phe)-imidazoG37] synthetase (radical SAM superfamily)